MSAPPLPLEGAAAGLIAKPLPSEIDPTNILKKRKQEQVCTDDCNFIATSSSLNTTLPSDKEASYKSWKGYIEELHVPTGGIIRLTESTALQWAQDRQRVYFHRSRLYVNGVRMSSNAVLQDEIVIGDLVQVDVIPNQLNMTTTFISGTEAFWVGLSIKVNTVDRGVTLSNRLRAEVPSNGMHLPMTNCQIHRDTLAMISCHTKKMVLIFTFFVFYRESIHRFMLPKCVKEEWYT